MELSKEDKAILAHVIIDPDTWVAHALAVIGVWAVTAKIERWKPEYLFQKDLPGYQTRAEREAQNVVLNLGKRNDYPALERIKEKRVNKKISEALNIKGGI